MLFSPFFLTPPAGFITIFILKLVVEGQNYHYDNRITKFAAIWNKVYC